jgi:hypothetical protein
MANNNETVQIQISYRITFESDCFRTNCEDRKCILEAVSDNFTHSEAEVFFNGSYIKFYSWCFPENLEKVRMKDDGSEKWIVNVYVHFDTHRNIYENSYEEIADMAMCIQGDALKCNGNVECDCGVPFRNIQVKVDNISFPFSDNEVEYEIISKLSEKDYDFDFLF